MAKNHAALIDLIEAELQDTGNAIWTAAELAIVLKEALVEFSNYVPYIVKETLTTTADSKDLDIRDITNLLWIDELEYRVGKTPQEFRNFVERSRHTITMLTNINPSADESVYLYCAKPQRVPSITDVIGAVDLGAGYSAGDTAMHVDGLGDGTIDADTEFVIASDSTETVYRLTADATIASNEGDISFTPGLAEDVAEDDVVTFETSTLTPQLERILVELTAARTILSYSVSKINKLNVAGKTPWRDYVAWAQAKLANVLADLERQAEPKNWVKHPRD